MGIKQALFIFLREHFQGTGESQTAVFQAWERRQSITKKSQLSFLFDHPPILVFDIH
jgi:hypothetical protein